MKNKIINLLIVFGLILTLTACQLTNPVKPLKPVVFKLNCNEKHVDPLNLKPVMPRSIRSADGVPGVHLTPEDYTNLAYNIQGMRRWMLDQKNVSQYYWNCISQFNNRVDEFEQQEQPQEEKRSFLDKLMN